MVKTEERGEGRGREGEERRKEGGTIPKHENFKRLDPFINLITCHLVNNKAK